MKFKMYISLWPFDRPILLFANQYTLNTFMDKNPDIDLVEALAVDDNF